MASDSCSERTLNLELNDNLLGVWQAMYPLVVDLDGLKPPVESVLG